MNAKTNKSSEQELLAIVDYILNRADTKTIEVISEAVKRREQELSHEFAGLSGISPENMAKKMSESINQSIEKSLGGVRDTVRNFAGDIIRQEAPGISEEELNMLLDSWVPDGPSPDGKLKSIAKNGKVSGIPADVLYGMILQFVSYGIGEMPDSENKSLRDSMGNWTEKYWAKFPVKIQQEIKRFISGEISSGEFKKNIGMLIS